MSYGAMIRERREKKGWTQRQLARVLGCSGGYIAHLENEVRTPSADICMALAQTLELTSEERQELLEVVEAARLKSAAQRIRARSEAVRSALQTHGTEMKPLAAPTASEASAKEVIRDFVADADWQAASRNLKTALANPQMREIVLNALRAFAQTARGDLLEIVRWAPQALASLVFRENWQLVPEFELGSETEKRTEVTPRRGLLTSGLLKGAEVRCNSANQLVITLKAPVPEGNQLKLITETGEELKLPVVRSLDPQGRAIYDLSGVSESPAFRLVLVEGEGE
ncbi:helix-turn-helix transcriptional regulator [Candidatus Poribacteria bacterium]|nr:helix-turn-helix transcriptional regulator [Candidatus Poribacteria bacterium]